MVDWDFGDVGSVWQNYSEQNVFYPCILVILKWKNTNYSVEELNNENLYQIIINTTAIGVVTSWIIGEELEILRASGSAEVLYSS